MSEILKLFSKAKSKEELTALLEVLLTPSEREELGQRYEIIKALNAGRTQREVAAEVGVSIGTVSRGARELKYSPHKDIIMKLLNS